MMPRDLWLDFKATGVQEIDDILAMVSHCAKIQRNTENWEDDFYDPSVVQMIQTVANKSAVSLLSRCQGRQTGDTGSAGDDRQTEERSESWRLKT